MKKLFATVHVIWLSLLFVSNVSFADQDPNAFRETYDFIGHNGQQWFDVYTETADYHITHSPNNRLNVVIWYRPRNPDSGICVAPHVWHSLYSAVQDEVWGEPSCGTEYGRLEVEKYGVLIEPCVDSLCSDFEGIFINNTHYPMANGQPGNELMFNASWYSYIDPDPIANSPYQYLGDGIKGDVFLDLHR